jgi:16S rRNA (guanine966-N2)-methyltransferase
MADAGRVIAGSARGIRLAAPGAGTRPIGDRVKQTLFAILDPDLRDARVLDLYAGSGAAGIEGLSRGAASAVFVERDAGACAVIKANLERARLAAPGARVVKADAIAWLAGPAAAEAGPFDLVIADPPYEDTAALVRTLELLDPLLARGARVVAKHFWRDPPPATVGLLASERERRFGETSLTFYRRQEAP